MNKFLPNTSNTLSPQIEARDSGWEISGIYATHYPCNAGIMRSIGPLGLEVGKIYVATYVVDQYTSGYVRIVIGTSLGGSHTAAGEYTEVLQYNGGTEISFESNGALRLTLLSVYEQVPATDNYTTISFYEGVGSAKKWMTRYSYSPDILITFLNSLFSVKNGQLWKHNISEVRNNFYGVQGISRLTFFINNNPTAEKLFYSLREEASRPWFAPANTDIQIKPTEGKSQGMQSRLKKNRFNRLQGSYFADFLRNILDPRPQFVNELQRLMKGAELRGRVMEISLINTDTEEVVLFEVDVKSALSYYTY